VGLKSGERLAICEHLGPANPPVNEQIGEMPEPFLMETDRGPMMLRHLAMCDVCWKKAKELDNCRPMLTRHCRYDGEDYIPKSWTFGRGRP
jgi:hypothetical protein